ncbi:hypothetical protein [Frateuria defendens]|uniref:hypothetical protein n=1 Tax=Frateuria defendens TaxID=2219559 RepID=UPI00066FE89B|nr:hypothetical protein [Frateuria defendens]
MTKRIPPIRIPSLDKNEAPKSTERAIGFGDGGEYGVHLFHVNASASPAEANEFAVIAREAIDDLLDEAIMDGTMSGTRAWVVQVLNGAIKAAEDYSDATR